MRAPALRDQPGRERYHVEHGARLIDECAHHHETQGDQPLPEQAARARGWAHGERAVGESHAIRMPIIGGSFLDYAIDPARADGAAIFAAHFGQGDHFSADRENEVGLLCHATG